MDMSIKEHIIGNFKNDSLEDIYAAIEESVSENDEVTLPGLGVFMSLIWEISNKDEKKNLVKKIKEALK